MTPRDMLNQTRKQLLAWFTMGMLLIASGFLGVSGSAIAGVGLIVLGVLFVCVSWFIVPLLGKCPNCRHRWGSLLVRSGAGFAVPASIKYCPYCGHCLDETLSSEDMSRREV